MISSLQTVLMMTQRESDRTSSLFLHNKLWVISFPSFLFLFPAEEVTLSTNDIQSVCSCTFKKPGSRTNGSTAEIGFQPQWSADSVTLWSALSSMGRKMKTQTCCGEVEFSALFPSIRKPSNWHRGRCSVIGRQVVEKVNGATGAGSDSLYGCTVITPQVDSYLCNITESVRCIRPRWASPHSETTSVKAKGSWSLRQ